MKIYLFHFLCEFSELSTRKNMQLNSITFVLAVNQQLTTHYLLPHLLEN